MLSTSRRDDAEPTPKPTMVRIRIVEPQKTEPRSSTVRIVEPSRRTWCRRVCESFAGTSSPARAWASLRRTMSAASAISTRDARAGSSRSRTCPLGGA
jgi:hypothetical protein